MNTIDRIRDLSAKRTDDRDLHVVVDLLNALEQSRTFEIEKLTELSFEYFNLAIDLIRCWRLNNHSYKKSKST